MARRHVLLATLGALGLSVAGCGHAGGGAGPDGAVGDDDAPPDAAGPPDTAINSGPSGDVTAGMQLAYTFTSVPGAPGTTFECRVDATSSFASIT